MLLLVTDTIALFVLCFSNSFPPILQATVEDENLCLLKLANVGPGILLMSNDCEQIVQAVTHVKTRWQLSQPVSLHALIKK